MVILEPAHILLQQFGSMVVLNALMGFCALGGLAMAGGGFNLRKLGSKSSVRSLVSSGIVSAARDTILESMSDGVIVLDGESRVVDINPAARKMIERNGDDLTGLPANEVLSAWPELVERLENTATMQSDVALDNVASRSTSNGYRRWLDLRISPIFTRSLNPFAAPHPAGRTILLRDITARKQAETAIQEYTRDLENQVIELDSCARTVAHDLRNPLGVITGHSSLLVTEKFHLTHDETQKSLHIIAQTGKKMLRIIDELLLLASLHKANQVQIERLDMDQIVTDARARFSTVIAQTQAEILLPPGWPSSLGYGPWIEEVWANYISNAIKYGGRPPHIELGSDYLPPVRPAGDGHGAPTYVRFWARDNGRGLTPEERSHLFVEFNRLNQVRARGTGLGLSIVRHIIERLGGQVGVESSPGEGSLFYFTLPAYRAQE
jgi:PAS domain S-box-containing protein